MSSRNRVRAPAEYSDYPKTSVSVHGHPSWMRIHSATHRWYDLGYQMGLRVLARPLSKHHRVQLPADVER